MLKISILNRTNKIVGDVRLRFRIKDGRKCDITHKSGIKAGLLELGQFDNVGRPRPYVTKYNAALMHEIREEIEILEKAYRAAAARSAVVDSAIFRAEYEKITRPDKTPYPTTLQTRFEKYINDSGRAGVFGDDRIKAYHVAAKILYRFLTISGMQDIQAQDVSAQTIIDFGYFILNEYEYAPKWLQLYVDCREIDIPKKPRSQNTAAKYLKMLNAFFNELESMEEIAKNPFNKMSKEKRQRMTRERNTAPIPLYAEEFAKILNTDVPDSLQEVKKTFLVQCALGCRVGDFAKMKMQNISVAPQGFAYIHYLPAKTASRSKHFEETETPLLQFVLDIVKGCGFRFNILRNVTGQAGYNAQIKKLLKYCGIDRKCTQHNEQTGENEYIPLYELGSSKLARKTCTDMLHKVQLNPYAAGLHSLGSSAVNNYTQLELKDRFLLMCIAYGQPQYKVNANLDYI